MVQVGGVGILDEDGGNEKKKIGFWLDFEGRANGICRGIRHGA